MSFTCGTPRVNFFSNPDVIHLNKPTGTLMDDNARNIEDNMVRGNRDINPNFAHSSRTGVAHISWVPYCPVQTRALAG